jgi:hypothetical protein
MPVPLIGQPVRRRWQRLTAIGWCEPEPHHRRERAPRRCVPRPLFLVGVSTSAPRRADSQEPSRTHVAMTITLQSLATAAAVGALSGTDTAIWGMYKDSIHEGFSAPRFARSVVVGAVVAVIIQVSCALHLPSASAIVLLFGLAYAAERGLVEVWKTFVREEDQSKYTIPMRFSVRGVPVASRAARLAAGGAYSAIVLLAAIGVARLDRSGVERSFVLVGLLGLAVGLIIAFGGAWKDAPTEGFESLKFFRSPCLTIAFTLMLAQLTTSYLEATVAAIGYERAASEMYKTFFFPSRPRGKFAGKPVLYPEMLARRRHFVPAYVAIRALLLAFALAAYQETTSTYQPGRLERERTDESARP